jgi:hypothetical protein
MYMEKEIAEPARVEASVSARLDRLPPTRYFRGLVARIAIGGWFDLPEPDGPHTTTTSPLLTSVVQPVSTWKGPYHFETLLIEIIVKSS